MTLSGLDWTIVGIYFLFVLTVGLLVSKNAGKSISEFFLSGRNMPWWLLGISMVATTFSADTPNLVTDLVRQSGVSGNWGWWCLLITGMLTVFVYAKLWRRSMVLTDIEFYELRYSGKAAAFLRGFRALYLGLIFNVVVMGAVSLAAVKFGEIVLGWPGWLTLLIAGSITVAYSTFGGLRAVLITDFVQFILAMIGAVWACIYIINLPEVGGVAELISHPNVFDKINIFPDFSDPSIYVPVLIVPLAVQWWASYYPGSEPGGGGYIAQRMFSAKDEKNAIGATLVFNIAHYALRPWPWILIALASLIIYPELSDIQRVFPTLSEGKLGHDAGYPAMLTLLPSGLLGLVAASLIAAFMSTMSTQLNLGSSYLVNDFYQRFINPEASQKELIKWARIFTVGSAFLGLGFGLLLTDASGAFNLLLLLGAGTGLIYILRWFWWRINAVTEIIAMVSSLFIASYFSFINPYISRMIAGSSVAPEDVVINHGLTDWQTLVVGSLITTLVWIVSAYLTRPTKMETLISFYQKIRPGGNGWKKVIDEAKKRNIVMPTDTGNLALELVCVVIGFVTVYSLLFCVGNWIYGKLILAAILALIAGLGMTFLMFAWRKLKF
ncbi:sodium:solute symporter family protein [Portibacter lacus]|uniref:Sodium/glucose cotransporter n=1 Tax=Portibacter lacus TaxID=1099794 RepID=A0AA37WDZ1_9BACT|nr:sodium:solute symporter family protein [Portibacter lacus]GLR18356.1 sodium/glucose cotransporter [Portibacter lacus]